METITSLLPTQELTIYRGERRDQQDSVFDKDLDIILAELLKEEGLPIRIRKNVRPTNKKHSITRIIYSGEAVAVVQAIQDTNEYDALYNAINGDSYRARRENRQNIYRFLNSRNVINPLEAYQNLEPDTSECAWDHDIQNAIKALYWENVARLMKQSLAGAHQILHQVSQESINQRPDEQYLKEAGWNLTYAQLNLYREILSFSWGRATYLLDNFPPLDIESIKTLSSNAADSVLHNGVQISMLTPSEE